MGIGDVLKVPSYEEVHFMNACCRDVNRIGCHVRGDESSGEESLGQFLDARGNL